MKIGVISDTHIPHRAKNVPAKVMKLFEGADMILHAGDLVRLDVIDELSALAPVHAVSGNMDEFGGGTLPDKKVITAGNWRIGLTHGWGAPLGLAQRVKKMFEGEKLDCIVFGHSHSAHLSSDGGVMILNPGSPTDTVFAPYLSVAILYAEEELKGEIIRL
ncbi:MAG: metallophosphoesterase family protein [bacterium]